MPEHLTTRTEADRPVRVHTSTARYSDALGLFPLVERPWHLPATVDVDRLRIAPAAAAALAALVPPAWSPPYARDEAQRRLLRWTMQLDDLIADSSRSGAYIEALGELDEATLYQAEQWLRGWWTNDDRALAELLWRLELGQKTISAALWLHRIGAA